MKTTRLLSVTVLSALAALVVSHASAAPEPLRALIIDGQNNHNWVETTPVMKAQLEQSGRFVVEVLTSPAKGEDMSGFKPDFAAYDVVVSNYNGDAWPEETREAFEKYMREGGGFVCVHAADNAFGNWEAYNEIIGFGGWGGRNQNSGPYLRIIDGEAVKVDEPGRAGGHGSRHEFVIDNRAPEHPVMRGLPERFKQVVDELYHEMRGPLKNVTVLASAFSDPATRGTGHHEPVLLAIDYGEGRCFHTVLGHDGPAMKGLAFQVTFVRGTEWAATGEVTVDDSKWVAQLSEGQAASHDPLAEGE